MSGQVKRTRRRWIDRHAPSDDEGLLSPFQDSAAFWRVLAQGATVAMFFIVFGALLYFARPLLLPVLSAIVVGMTIGPAASWAGRRGVPAWAVALLVTVVIVGGAYVAIVTMSEPASDLIARSAEFGAAVKEKFQLFERPLAALKELQGALGGSGAIAVDTTNQSAIIAGVVTVVTPAAVQIVLFLGTLFFFIIGREEFRRVLINLFDTRDGRLRALKILNDIEHSLNRYLFIVTIINLCVGLFVAAVTWLFGLPNPLLLGALAFVLNYIPYIGPGVMHLTLFVLGLVTYPTLVMALIPPAITVTFTVVEGQFIMPNVVGRRLDMRPLAVFLNLAFWAWLWGPIGAFLSVPILIVFTVALHHLYPRRTVVLPE